MKKVGYVRLVVKSMLSLSIVCVMASQSVMADLLQFDISASANRDLVYESGGGADAFGSADQTYLENGYSGAAGLPSSRSLSSSQAGLGSYALMSYSGNNAIQLSANSSSPNVSYSIDVPDYGYSQIGMLIAGQNGDVSFGYTLNYADSSSETGWWEADDWYDEDLRGNMHVTLSGMDTAYVGDGNVNDLNHISIYEFLITPGNSAKEIASIDINNSPNRWSASGDGYGAVFAMNGNTTTAVPEPTSLALLALSLGGLWIYRRKRLA